MCGIAGFHNALQDFKREEGTWHHVLDEMNQVQKHRGPDDEGIYLTKSCGLAHVRLSIIDLNTGHQPMVRQEAEQVCAIVYNGEIYNMHPLKKKLEAEGVTFETASDTEVILAGYMRHGLDFVKELNGIFSYAIWDNRIQKLYLFRDRLGVKPLFFTKQNGTLIFSSEIKGIFAYPNCKPMVDHDGLCEIFALGPAKTYGKGVFKDIKEVLPGTILECSKEGIKEHVYWELTSKPHEDTFDQTVDKTAFLVKDAVTSQMLSDTPISTFLSGGVDSSLITAICAEQLKKQGKVLNTFSFDFTDNQKYFKSNSFQPSEDRPWVDIMKDYSGTNHRYLECDKMKLESYLYKAVDARDLPCMADVESSLLYFCSQVTPHNKVTLTGECADEIFGGYPWFHKQESFDTHAFPWSNDMDARKALLKDDIIAELHMDEYANAAYEKTIQETPVLYGENKQEARRREIAFLNIKWFMVTLLDRMDRTSMHSGLEARVPLADHRILEYIWNVPWDMKCPNGMVKGLLRKAGEGYLPKEILYRKKSPYPKTYDPSYEKMLGEKLLEVVTDPRAPIRDLIDTKKVVSFLENPSDYGRPWYGQLMAGPQMLAFLLQTNYWLEKYHITVI